MPKAPGSPTLPAAKKPKIDKSAPTEDSASEFPNGFIYCHQCNKKRDISAAIQCTFKEIHVSAKSKKPKERRCLVKFCQPCLRNRYGTSMEVIKAQPKEAGHVDDETYTFKCPKCRDVCNCPRCRKSKGLEPTGNLAFARRALAATSSVPGVNGLTLTTIPRAEPKPKPPPKAPKASSNKPKVLPLVKWTRFRPGLTVDDAEQRMHIREFILRFEPVMKPTIAKTHLEELAHLTGGTFQADDDQLMDDLVPWVSEACCKSIILGLLGILADEAVDDSAPVLKSAIRDIRSSGTNISKVWSVMAGLREEFGDIKSGAAAASVAVGILTLNFPDPLPPPIAYNMRSTRSTRGEVSSIHIATTAQMIPTITGLIDVVLQTDTIRADFEDALKEAKEKTKETREAIKTENSRWEASKKELESVKEDEFITARHTHRHKILDIENSLKIIMNAFVPRFAPLGTDTDGTNYWALTPGHYERDEAYNYFDQLGSSSTPASGSAKAQGKKRLARDEVDRAKLEDWSWFVLAWGKRPVESTIAVVPDGDEDLDVDESTGHEHGWWAFWEPDEIRKLAQYIEVKSGLGADGVDDDGDGDSGYVSDEKTGDSVRPQPAGPTKDALVALVQSLNDYGALLAWRTRPSQKQ